MVSLTAVVLLWGASNAATRYIVQFWPPGWTGGTRFFCAGLLLIGVLKWTPWLGTLTPLTPVMSRDLWLRSSLSLAVYIVVFNLALHYTTASHVAIYLGTSPVWALMWDHPLDLSWSSARRYGAASLAFLGVFVLCWPKLRAGNSMWLGEALGLASSFLWAAFGISCRSLGNRLSGAEISAHTMWRSGVWLAPLAAFEVFQKGLTINFNLAACQAYCCVGGGVFAYALWNNALRHWPTSQVYLFNNLIPPSTMFFAWLFLGEPITKTFGLAMALVLLGVALGRARWETNPLSRWLPPE